VAISADSPRDTGDLCRKAGLTYPVLSDAGLDAIRRYDLEMAEKGTDGHAAGGPGEFLIDSSGTVRWRKLTEMHPPEILAAARLVQ
jgi:peroxiredoxin